MNLESLSLVRLSKCINHFIVLFMLLTASNNRKYIKLYCSGVASFNAQGIKLSCSSFLSFYLFIKSISYMFVFVVLYINIIQCMLCALALCDTCMCMCNAYMGIERSVLSQTVDRRPRVPRLI